MKTIFATYPWAYFTPGGGEYQLEKLYNAIKKGTTPQKNSILGNPKWNLISIITFRVLEAHMIFVII